MTIKELVTLSGMSQTAFARKLHIPLRTVQDWCRGKRTPPAWVPELIQYRLGL